MKKRNLLIFVLIFILFGCKMSTITLDDFTNKATFNGYIVRSDKTGYETYKNILNVSYAVNRENAYSIQFLELNNEDYAHKFFLLNKKEIQDNISSNDYEKSKNTNNYELYHAETMSDYYLVIRSDKNIVYITAPINYINEIEEFLNDLSLEY